MQFLFAIVLLLASHIISSLVGGKPQQTATKPTLESDFDFPQADEGTAQAIAFGDVWTPAWMVLWHGKFRTANPAVVGGGDIGSEPPPEVPGGSGEGAPDPEGPGEIEANTSGMGGEPA